MTTLPPLPPPPKRFKYHVLFSYASADKEYVGAVRAALPKEVKVFDYAMDDSVIWGEDLAKELEHRYKNEAPFCVVFISETYLKKPWTNKELVIVQRVGKGKPGYMLPVLFDGIKVPAIENIAWLENTLPAKKLAARIVAKIREPPRKPWWFYVSTEVKVAIASVPFVLIVAARVAYLLIWPSRTSLKSADANGEIIIAHVKNDGPKSATLVGQRLKFGTLPIQDTELRLAKSESATIAPGEHDVKLTTFELLTKCGPDEIMPGRGKVEPLLDQQPITLEIDIRESNDAPGQSRRRIAKFPAAHLKPTFVEGVSTYDTPCN
jgi:hypothetical protein